jgi:sugar phosphate isomerase/epimerase
VPDTRAVSLAALTVLEASPVDAVSIAARCGYSHIGLRPVPATPEEPHVPILTDISLQRELAARLEGEGLAVLDMEIVRLREVMDWSAMEAVLAFAQKFGAHFLLVADNDPEPARSRDSLARLADMAAAYDVVPHLEFMPWTCSPNLAAAQARTTGLANCGLLVDAFHLARSGGVPTDIAAHDPATGYLQLCDIAGPIPAMDEILREARSDRLFPGEGEIDLVALLRRLPAIPVSLEIPADRLRDAGWSAEQRAQKAIAACRAVLERAGG